MHFATSRAIMKDLLHIGSQCFSELAAGGIYVVTASSSGH